MNCLEIEPQKMRHGGFFMKKTWMSVILCMALLVSSVNSSAVEINRDKEDENSVTIGSLETKYYFNFNGVSGGAVPMVKGKMNMSDENAGAELVEDSSKKVKFAEGKFGEALYLDGSYGVQLPVDELGPSYTIAFWVKPLKNMTNYMPILQAGKDLSTGNSKKWLNITKTDFFGDVSPVIWSKDDKYYENIEGNYYWPWYAGRDEKYMEMITPANGWQHIILTVDGAKRLNLYDENVYSSTSATYINGKLHSTGVIVDDLFDSGVEVYLGINPWDDFFTGFIDELQFYNTAVTEEQVAEIFAFDANKVETEDEAGGELTKSDLKVSPAKKTIKVGKSFYIDIKAVDESEWEDLSEEEWKEICEENIDNISFRSTKSSVASVGKTSGKVNGKKKGTAIIKTTIDFANGESATYKTKVYVTR